MLKQQITEFIAQCKVVDFAPKSIQSLTASLRELKTFLDEQGGSCRVAGHHVQAYLRLCG